MNKKTKWKFDIEHLSSILWSAVKAVILHTIAVFLWLGAFTYKKSVGVTPLEMWFFLCISFILMGLFFWGLVKWKFISPLFCVAPLLSFVAYYANTPKFFNWTLVIIAIGLVLEVAQLIGIKIKLPKGNIKVYFRGKHLK